MARKHRRKSRHRRDPAMESRDWPKQPIRHARASHKGWKRKMGSSWRPKSRSQYAGWFRRPRRDPEMESREGSESRDWPKQPIRHARASHKGWKRKMGSGWRPKSRSHYAGWFKRGRDPELGMGRDWTGDPVGHARAGKKGWRVTAKSGWRPKHPTPLPSSRGGKKHHAKKSAARRHARPKIFHAKMAAPRVRVTRVTHIAIAPRRRRHGFKTAKGREIAARLRGEGWVRSSKTGRWTKKHGFFRGQRLSAGQTSTFAASAQAPRHPDSWMRQQHFKTPKGREVAARLEASGWAYQPKTKRWHKRSAGVGQARDPSRRRRHGRRDWPGHGKEHARVARKGWRHHAKKSWRPKHPELRKFRGRDADYDRDGGESSARDPRMKRRHKRHALRSRYHRSSHYGRGY